MLGPTASARKKLDDEASGEIETVHTGYVGSQETFYVGTMKGVGRVYQQTFCPPRQVRSIVISMT